MALVLTRATFEMTAQPTDIRTIIREYAVGFLKKGGDAPFRTAAAYLNELKYNAIPETSQGFHAFLQAVASPGLVTSLPASVVGKVCLLAPKKAPVSINAGIKYRLHTDCMSNPAVYLETQFRVRNKEKL